MAWLYLFPLSALKSLPIGVAYSIWTGIGAIGTVILVIILFNESREVLKIVFVLMIVCGIVGLKLITGNTSN